MVIFSLKLNCSFNKRLFTWLIIVSQYIIKRHLPLNGHQFIFKKTFGSLKWFKLYKLLVDLSQSFMVSKSTLRGPWFFWNFELTCEMFEWLFCNFDIGFIDMGFDYQSLILSVGFKIISYKHRWVQPIYNLFAN
jgi:hypothetical protein